MLQAETVLYRALSVMTAVATLTFLAVLVGVFAGLRLGPNSEVNVVGLAAGGIAIGLLTMIAHLNLDRTIADSAKAQWRSALWWAGPWAAAGYLVDFESGSGAKTRDQLTCPL